MTDTRPCTCAPDERPYPCQHKYALGLCRKAEIRSLRTALDRLIAQIADLTKLRLEDELVHGNVMGRIALALFGDQNNRTDEECVARAAEIGYELSGAKQRAEHAEAELAAARALLREAVPLLREVIVIHADPDDPNYNDCDKPNEQCLWCVNAQTIIGAALAGEKTP